MEFYTLVPKYFVILQQIYILLIKTRKNKNRNQSITLCQCLSPPRG